MARSKLLVMVAMMATMAAAGWAADRAAVRHAKLDALRDAERQARGVLSITYRPQPPARRPKPPARRPEAVDVVVISPPPPAPKRASERVAAMAAVRPVLMVTLEVSPMHETGWWMHVMGGAEARAARARDTALAAARVAARDAEQDAATAAVLAAALIAVMVGGTVATRAAGWLFPRALVVAEEALTNADDQRHRVVRVSAVWTRFGFFLPPRRRRLFEADLAEHTADLYEALAGAKSRREQDRWIRRFTLAAGAKALNHARVAFQRRLGDDFRWVAGRLPRG